MSTMRFVFLLASTLATAAVLIAVAQSPAPQRGVSVKMAVTNNAAPMPDADNQNAWIVTAAANGSLYFGIDPVTRDGLLDVMIRTPRNREQKLYIKADARAQFASVKAALAVARSSNFEEVVLLASQPDSHDSGTVVPPKGIEVQLGGSAIGGAIMVGLSDPAQGSTLTVTINDRRVTSPELVSTLQGLLHGHAQVVQVEANDAVPFGDVMRVIDEVRAAGATVALPTYGSL
jgi:biopolymer transport protein ExbD